MAQSGAPAARASLESGAFTFHYIIDNDVCYLTLVEKSYPKKLAYQYLEELQREFFSLYGREIEQAKRPYAFIKFGENYSNSHVTCHNTSCAPSFATCNALQNASVLYAASHERHMSEHCLQTPSYRKPRNCTLTHEHSGTWQS